MSLYLFGKDQRLVKKVPNKRLFSLVQDEEINKMDTLRSELRLKDWNEIKDESFYMGVRAPDSIYIMYLYRITRVNELTNRVELSGINIAHDELKGKGYVERIVGDNLTVRDVLQQAVAGTDWTISVNLPSYDNISMDVEYTSRIDIIREVIKQTGGEVEFRVGMYDDNKVNVKRIYLHKDLSEFKGKRFALGSKLLEVTREEDISELNTALVGTGGSVKIDESNPDSEEVTLTFADVEWSIDNGDPVDKPLGQKYVEIPGATELYGYADGSPRVGVVNFSSETNAENVLIQTYNELLVTSRPKRQFKATVEAVGEDMELGETVAIIKPGTDFRYMTRVYKLQRDYLNNNRTTVEFGDRLTKTPHERLQTIKDDTKDIAEKVARDTVGSGGSGGSIDYPKHIYAITGTFSESLLADIIEVPQMGSGIRTPRMETERIIPQTYNVNNPLTDYFGAWDSSTYPNIRVYYASDIRVNQGEYDEQNLPPFDTNWDVMVDGYIISMEHFRGPAYPPNYNRQPGDFDNMIIDQSDRNPPQMKTVFYLFANDGRVYISWGTQGSSGYGMFYLTSNDKNITQLLFGY